MAQNERDIIRKKVKEIIEGYISRADWRVHENSNTDYSFPNLMLHASGWVIAEYVLNEVYKDMPIAEMHRKGQVHIHDLSGGIAPYCAGWSLKQLLDEGFNGVPGKTASKPAKHLRSAISHIVNFLGVMSNEWMGAQAFSDVDVYLAPYILKDYIDLVDKLVEEGLDKETAKKIAWKLTERDLRQSIQELLFNLNFPTRWGGQCVTEDTQVLTPKGWKKYNELNEGDEIYTVDYKNNLELKIEKVKKVNVYDYNGEMHVYEGDNFIQIVTPNHKVLYKEDKKPNLLESEKLINKKTIYIPTYNCENKKVTWDVVKNKTKITYKGKVWCPTTDTGVVIFRKDGKTFISGNSPFTNFTLALTVPEDLKDMPATVANKPVEYRPDIFKVDNDEEKTYYTYQDLQDFINLFNKTFFEVYLEGDANGRVFTFPVLTVNLTEDFFNLPKDLLDVILEANAKYGATYFQNCINGESGLEKIRPSDVRSMCCRLQLNLNELQKHTGGLFGNGEYVGCYDEETRVLTDKGWKYFKDVDIENDLIATLNPETHEMEYVKATEKFVYDYEGELIQFYNEKSFESPLVTPNHRMYVEKVKTNGEHESFFLEAQEDFSHSKYTVPKSAYFKGEKKEFIEIDEQNISYTQNVDSPVYKGKRTITKTYEKIKFPIKPFLRFLGIYIGDGSIRIKKHGGYEIVLTHGNNERKRKSYKKVLEDLGINFNEENGKYVFYSIQLYKYLKGKVGDSFDTKRIPREILNLDAELLKELFEGLISSDGYKKEKDGRINKLVYYTSNKKLAYDVLELISKIGFSGRVLKRDRRDEKRLMEGRQIKTKELCYEVHIKISKRLYYSTLKKRKVHYKGKVYCLEVPPYHTMLVERNGNIMWCGNSIGVVTLNLPEIGYLAKKQAKSMEERKKKFLEILEDWMDKAKDGLLRKREVILENFERGLYPYTKRYLVTKFKTHFLTIGYVGLHEAMKNLGYEDGLLDEEAHKFSQEVLDFMREKTKEYQQKYGCLFNLEATPSEGASYRLARLSKKRIPDLITSGTEEVPYFTNSCHPPVWSQNDLVFLANHQNELQNRHTGGTVVHFYLGEKPDKETLLELLKILGQTKIPYFTFTTVFSVCPVHGYIPGEHPVCPYPHTEEELKRWGVDIENLPEEIQKLVKKYEQS